MTASNHIKEEILKKIEHAPNEMLLKFLNFVQKLEEQSKKERLLSFSGIWKDLDEEIIDDLTTDLHKRRSKDIRP